MSAPASAPTQTPRPPRPSKARETVGMLVVLGLVIAAVWLSDANWSRLKDIPANIWLYGELMLSGLWHNPFADPWAGYWWVAIESMMESVYMAWVGTLIGAVLSLPLGFLAARNLAPPVVVQGVRLVLNAIRAIPELIFAIVLIMPIFGLGPISGTLALGIGAVGTLGKLTAEAIEGIDPGPVEAATASGAGRLAILRWSVFTQVLPEVLAFWLYRFEINIRASAVLGVIGAGGIGSLLSELFNRREWEQIGITLAVVIAVTMLVDAASGAIRHRIISGGGVRGRAARRDEAEALV